MSPTTKILIQDWQRMRSLNSLPCLMMKGWEICCSFASCFLVHPCTLSINVDLAPELLSYLCWCIFWLLFFLPSLQFMRLQGKRNRGKEEVKFLEIKGDDQLSGNQQWMTKNLSEEKQNRQSYSKVTMKDAFCVSQEEHDCGMMGQSQTSKVFYDHFSSSRCDNYKQEQ